MPPHTSSVPFVPVVMGGELATYTLARAFHAELGVRTTVMTRGIPAPVRGSAIIDNEVVPGLDDLDEVVAAVHRVADARPGQRVMVMGTMDWWVERVTALRDRFDERVVVPYPELPLIERLSDKERFAQVCAEVGVTHPRTVVVGSDVPEADVPALLADLRPPLVVKPADSPAFHGLIYAGKQKVGYADDVGELLALRRVMSGAGYAGALVVQERVPGGDEQMRVLTTYSDRSGKVRWGRMGHVLLEDHDP